MVEHYVSTGWEVYGCSRQESDFQNEHYTHFICDVSDGAAVEKMFKSIRDQGKQLDVLVNNAGLASMNHVLLTPVDTLDKLFQTNYKGSFLCAQAAGKIMMRQKSGCIINLSTVAVPLNLEGEAVYASSKSAVESLTKILAKELGAFGIRVNAIGPTPISTDLIKAVPKEKIENLINQQAIKRLGRVEDVLNLLDFLIQPESEFISGQVIYLGGVS